MMHYTCGQCHSSWVASIDEHHMPGCSAGPPWSLRDKAEEERLRRIVREEIERALNR